MVVYVYMLSQASSISYTYMYIIPVFLDHTFFPTSWAIATQPPGPMATLIIVICLSVCHLTLHAQLHRHIAQLGKFAT